MGRKLLCPCGCKRNLWIHLVEADSSDRSTNGACSRVVFTSGLVPFVTKDILHTRHWWGKRGRGEKEGDRDLEKLRFLSRLTIVG